MKNTKRTSPVSKVRKTTMTANASKGKPLFAKPSAKPSTTSNGGRTSVKKEVVVRRVVDDEKRKRDRATVRQANEFTKEVNSLSQKINKSTSEAIKTQKVDVRRYSVKKPIGGAVIREKSLTHEAVNKTENVLKSQGDSGSVAVAYGIAGAKASYKVGKVAKGTFVQAQKISVPIQKATVAVAKTGYRAVRTVDSALGLVKTGTYTIGQANKYLLNSFLLSAPVQKIKTGVVKGAKTTARVVTTPYRAVRSGYRAVKNVALTAGMVKTGTITVGQGTKYLLQQLAGTKPVKKIVNGMVVVGGRVKTGVVKGAKTTARVVTTPYRVVKGGYTVVKNVALTAGMVKPGAITVGQGVKNVLINSKPVITGGIKDVVAVAKVGKKVGKVSMQVGKGTLRVGNKIGSALATTDDMGLQGVGMGLKTAYYTSKYAPKLAKATVSGAKTTVKFGIKTGKVTVQGFSFVGKNAKTMYKVGKRFGAKKMVGAYGKRMGTASVKAMKKGAKKGVKAVGNAISNALSALLQKIAVPLLVILLGFFLVFIILSAGASAVATVISPFSSDKDTGEEIDETAWLTEKITDKREKQIDDIEKIYKRNKKSEGGEYDIVRFYNGKTDTEVELTKTNIGDSLYSEEEYLNVIQPIFHVVLLSEYELDASKFQMGTVFNKIWDEIDVIREDELPIEWCNSKIADADGNVHAGADCPNHGDEVFHGETVDGIMCECDVIFYNCKGHQGAVNCGYTEHTHSYGCSYTCGQSYHVHTSSCEGQTCDGNHIDPVMNPVEGATGHPYSSATCMGYTCGQSYHVHSGSCCSITYHSHTAWTSKESTGCYSTTQHGSINLSDCGNSDPYKYCYGYFICKGHKVLKLYVDLQSFDKMLDKYFRDEIRRLENKSNPSDDEKERLSDLKENLQLCLDYIEVLENEFGGTSVGRN